MEPIRLTVGNKIAIGAAEICLVHQILIFFTAPDHSRPCGCGNTFFTVCNGL